MFFRHTDGGYYRHLHDALSADDTSRQVVYEHVWPFARGVWVRREDEWLARFKAVSESEVIAAQAGVQADAQEAVKAAKAARRQAAALAARPGT